MNTWTLILVILTAALSRMIPHPPNFTPIAAIALFGAATLKSRKQAFLIPLVALFLSDLGLEALYRLGVSQSWGVHTGMIYTYLLFLVVTFMGLYLRHNINIRTVASMTVLSTVFFFLSSNFLVWALSEMYPHTVEGLLLCYIAAIPFLQWSAMGDFFYVGILFGAYAMVESRSIAVAPAT